MFPRCTRILILAIITTSLFLIAGATHAETQMMILLDASGTLAGPGTPGTSHTKFDEVTAAVNNLLQNLPTDVAVGLRIMGGSPAADCYTTYPYFTPTQGIRSQIQDSLNALHPAGSRGLYQGIQDSLGDLSGGSGAIDRVLLVVTDGGDDCGRDFTDLARTYAYTPDAPRVVIYGTDLTASDRESLGEFVAEIGGRIINLNSTNDLSVSLEAFGREFENNLRIHLQDTEGNAVLGDIVVREISTNTIISEKLDIANLSLNVHPGAYEVTGRYLGQEIKSESFVMESESSRTVTLEFAIHLDTFTLSLRDLFGYPVRVRVVFVNSNNEPVLSSDVDSDHRVELPPDTYTAQIRLGDYTHEVPGIQIGPAYDRNMQVELPIEVGTLEVEVMNMYGFPLNAVIKIFDMDGTLIDEAPFSSYLYSRLPPGSYRITAVFEGYEVEEIAYLYSGDMQQVGLEIDVALGDIFVMLRTESGLDAWGWVKVYDMQGRLLERFDRERIESPDWYLTNIPVGIYRIQAEVDNIVRVVSSVEIRENEEIEVLITFPDETY